MRSRVEDLFHAVADLSEEERLRYFLKNTTDSRTREEVEALLAFDNGSSAPLERDIHEVALCALSRFEPKDRLCGPYRLGEFLGRGGMGTVYLAERVDGEVAQRAAVKLLRPGADDSRHRQRLLAERQILAGLSHPNIARLLDAGHREDGQPYLVMEYVEGTSIDAYAEGLGVRRKLTLFLKVCAAVSYLHRNLVVHRDLKPDNILVTNDGEPKLLDFGIAKMIEAVADSTATNMRMLTPDYASPEQVAARPVTTASDLYSLGAVLYKLLTGRSPHQFEDRSAEAIASVVCGGRITPAGRLVPCLKGDLEIILVKALRKEPEERYASVEQFAEDLEHYLASRPIRARRGDAWYRARKFLRRFWLPVAASALAAAGLSAGALVANQQRAVARRQFIQVRRMASKLFDIDAEVRRSPGTTRARELIVSTSLEYLERLADDVHHDPSLALELGTAYLRVARVQGVPIASNLGHADQAGRSLEMAERLIRPVLAARPANPTAMLRAAQIAHDRMILAGNAGASNEALRLARESLEWLRKYEGIGGVNPADVEDLAMTYTNVGGRYVIAEQYGEAIRLCGRAAEIAGAAGRGPQVAGALMCISETYRQQGELQEALHTIRESVRLLEPKAGVADRPRIGGLVNALAREGQILGEDEAISLGRPREALIPLERAFAVARRAVEADSSDADGRSRAATAGMVLADILRRIDPRRALVAYDRTLDLLSAIPENPRSRRQEARALAGSTDPLRRLGRDAEAKRRLDTAFALLARLKLYPAETIAPGREADTALCALAEYEIGRHQIRRAIDIYEELLRKVMASEPKPASSLADAVDLSRIYTALATLCRRAGLTPRAASLEARRLDLWRNWEARHPYNTYIQHQLGRATVPR